MPGIMLILDGMQDISYKTLGGKTPYDYGKKEYFKQFESQSVTGFLKTTPDGFEADTQTCILALLGVEAKDIPDGRSYIEAVACGINVGDEDLILRCNFVKVSEDGKLEIPCCSAPAEIAQALRAEVGSKEGTEVFPVGSYKSLQLLKGKKHYIKTLKTSTPHQHQGEDFESLLPTGNELADKLAEFSREMYKKYKPYTVLNWAKAVKADLPSFSELHKGKKGSMISATDAPIGAARIMGMECPRVIGATGDTDTDISAKVLSALDLLERNDFVMLHIGGPDEATHRQNEKEKAAFISKLDHALMKEIMEKVPNGTRVMLTCDHEALCTTAGHTEKPVKYWLWQKGTALVVENGLADGTSAIDILLG